MNLEAEAMLLARTPQPPWLYILVQFDRGQGRAAESLKLLFDGSNGLGPKASGRVNVMPAIKNSYNAISLPPSSRFASDCMSDWSANST